MEHVCDYIFEKLEFTDGAVNHPIMTTEPVANIAFCRENLYELLFECYGVSKVMTGIDAMFSLYKNQPEERRYE